VTLKSQLISMSLVSMHTTKLSAIT